jgi:hypothetical protein
MKKYINLSVLLCDEKGKKIYRSATFDHKCSLTKAFNFLGEKGYTIKDVKAERVSQVGSK